MNEPVAEEKDFDVILVSLQFLFKIRGKTGRINNTVLQFPKFTVYEVQRKSSLDSVCKIEIAANRADQYPEVSHG
jgi:hypothetical protein